MENLVFATVAELFAAIRDRQVSVVEVVDAYLAQITRYNPALNAVVTLDEEGARRQAVAADARQLRGKEWGPLYGIPVTLKDCHSTAGMRTTAGYPPLADYVPAEDGAIAAALKAAGAIILGKTNVSPLLMDIQADNPIFGRTNNPWDLTRTSGGSSGGAAAALAAGMTTLEIGSDFAGSIRIPAAFCGVYSLKPTEHRVSLAGHLDAPPGRPRADRILWSIGPLACNIEDLALAFQVIAGSDPADPDVPPLSAGTQHSALSTQHSALRLAWAPTFPGVPVAEPIRTALAHLATELERQGARVEEQLPDLSFEEQAQVRTQLAKMTQGAFAPPDAGPPPTLADYFTALDRRDAFIATWEAFFARWDALLCPVAMTTAFAHCPPGTPIPVDGTPEKYWRIIGHCTPFSLTGHPVVVIPVGHDPDGLPIGVQIVGARWHEARLLEIAARIAQVAGPFQRPPLVEQQADHE